MALLLAVAGVTMGAVVFLSKTPQIQGISVSTPPSRNDNSLLVDLTEPNANLYLSFQENSTISLYEYTRGQDHEEVFSFTISNPGYPVASQIANNANNEFFYIDNQLGQDTISSYNLAGTRTILYKSAKKIKSIYLANHKIYALARDTFAAADQYNLLEISLAGSVTSLAKFDSPDSLYLKYATDRSIYWGDLISKGCGAYRLTTTQLDSANQGDSAKQVELVNCTDIKALTQNQKFKSVETPTVKFSTPTLTIGGEKSNYRFPFTAKLYEAGADINSEPAPPVIYAAPANHHIEIISETTTAANAPAIILFVEDSESNYRQLVTVDLGQLAQLKSGRIKELVAQKLELPLANSVGYLGKTGNSADLYFVFVDSSGNHNLYSYSTNSNQLRWLELIRCQAAASVCELSHLSSNMRLI